MEKITKTWIAKALGITHPAIVQWERSGKIPADKCFMLEPIIGISAKELYEHPNLLFDKFNSTTPATSRVSGAENTQKETA